VSRRSSEEVERKRGRPGKAKAEQGWLGFVDVQLTDADKASLAEGHFEAGDAFQFVEEMVEDGYKVTLSQDTAHSCYIAAATGRLPDDPNNGYTLTGRGPDVIGSLACLAHKHIIICQRGAWSNSGARPAASSWG